MIRKLRIIVAIIILAFSFTVKADVFMELDCNSQDIVKDNKVTCDGNLIYGGIEITNIEFEYFTNSDITFESMPGFNLIKNDNKIVIHPDTPLYDDFLDNSIIMKIILTGNEGLSKTEELLLKNIKFNNSENITVDDIKKTFNIDNTKILDNNCYLDSLTIDKVGVPNFNKDVLEYRDIVIHKDVIFIDAVRSSNKSSATGLGEVFIKPGETIEHHVVVVAEDNTTKTYKLFITNKEDINNKKLNNDNSIKYLEIFNDKELIPFTFDSKKDNYNINISDSNISKLTIKATLNNQKASFVKGYGPREIDVKVGDNKILLKVKAQNNDEKIYTININIKDILDDNNELKSLMINNQEVDLEKLEIILPNNINKTDIIAIPKNDKALVLYQEKELEVGNNKINIEVVSVSGVSKIYEINVIREDILLGDIAINNISINTDNNLTNIICYLVFGLGVVMLIISIVHFKKKKNTIL